MFVRLNYLSDGRDAELCLGLFMVIFVNQWNDDAPKMSNSLTTGSSALTAWPSQNLSPVLSPLAHELNLPIYRQRYGLTAVFVTQYIRDSNDTYSRFKESL
jgi:hypothetical protein